MYESRIPELAVNEPDPLAERRKDSKSSVACKTVKLIVVSGWFDIILVSPVQ
jgi:hypothetical protein